MKFTAPKKELLDRLSTAFAAAPTRTPKDILKNVKATVDRGILSLMGTNEESSVVVSLPVDDSTDGSCVISHNMLLACREGQGKTVSFEVNGDKIKVYCGLGEWEFVSIDPDEFPVFRGADVAQIVANGAALERAIDQVSHAAESTAGQHAAFCGVLLSLTDGQLVVAAMDGPHMAFVEIPCESQSEFRVVIPKGAANVLKRMCDVGNIKIGGDENSFQMSSEWASLNTRLIDGRFPNHRAPIPPSFALTCTMDAGDLKSAFRQAMVTTNPETMSVEVEVNHDSILVSSLAAQIGRSKSSCACISNNNKTYRLNPQYVLDFLKRTDDDCTVTLHGNESDEILMLTSNAATMLIATVREPAR